MKAMPQPFEFQGKGVSDFSYSSFFSDSYLPTPKQQQNWHHNNTEANSCYVGSEPTSVLHTRSSSPPTSSSTLSSSQGGGGSGASTKAMDVAPAAVSATINQSVDTGTGKCGMGMEDWESVLSGSPAQDQSILRLIMGDVDDPSVALTKILQSGSAPQDLDFNAGYGVVDQGFGFDSINSSNCLVSNVEPSLVGNPLVPTNPLSASVGPCIFPQQNQPQFGTLSEKPPILNPQLIMNQNQAHFAQNPSMFLPLSYAQLQEHNMPSPPHLKRLNSGPNFPAGPKVPFSGSGQELYQRCQQQQLHMPQQRPNTPVGLAPGKPRTDEEMATQQLHEAIIDQLFKASELIETGNLVLAQGILARLNQQLSPVVGRPFLRAAFYFKEALQLLLHNNLPPASPSYSLIFKIGAYKSFSEISPVVQFSNFTCNQALIESFEAFDHVHVIDFDIGYGGQWASLMQELVLRNEGAPFFKITAFASPSSNDALELRFTQENLKQFANEINMAFEIEILSMECLNSGPWQLPIHVNENEAVAVNLPIGSFSNHPATLPVVLRFVKRLSPKVVVSLDRGCDRSDVPFPHHMVQALQSYSGLLESLDAANPNLDALQKIERLLLQPGIEKMVLGRHRCLERTPSWRTLFMQSGFSPKTFSNAAESQAECLVQRTPVRGFHVEKKQSSLVLYWEKKELVAASAWRC